ncbi:MAG: 1-acyl-sn-glycerol-3-phosphate acyltransferase, partial [Planktomarina temperata]|nr:1-acyl-sn-glycerol-3-phosphate acyltransferase [Planktomarina temperata]
MAYAVQWIRSLLFNIQMYVAMVIVAIVFLIPMIFSQKGASLAANIYCWWVVWSARWMIGLKVQVRGTVPTGEVLIAAKHQSFFDIIVIFNCLERSKFIMKRQLLFTPIVGQYAYRLGCIPVNRGKGAAAIRKMLADVASGRVAPGQLVIYPQGTR